MHEVDSNQSDGRNNAYSFDTYPVTLIIIHNGQLSGQFSASKSASLFLHPERLAVQARCTVPRKQRQKIPWLNFIIQIARFRKTIRCQRLRHVCKQCQTVFATTNRPWCYSPEYWRLQSNFIVKLFYPLSDLGWECVLVHSIPKWLP